MEMMVTLTQVSIYENFVRQGKTPLFFRASGKNVENVVGPGDCFTGNTVCRIVRNKRGQINIVHWKFFRKREWKGQKIKKRARIKPRCCIRPAVDGRLLWKDSITMSRDHEFSDFLSLVLGMRYTFPSIE